MKNKQKCGYCNKSILRYPTKTDTYFCNTACKGLWQILQREKLGFTKEWLYDQYFNQGKTCNDIAKDIKRDPKRVWQWFVDYGITITKRGFSKKQQFKKGHKQGVGRVHTDETKDKIREARIKDGHVPYLKNGKHWLHYYGVKPASWKGGVTPERQGFYSSMEWKDCIKAVWKRDNATCQRCNKHHNEAINRGSFHIHHIKSFHNKKYRAVISNLVLLCRPCHHFVHSKKNKLKLFIDETA